MLGTPLQPQQPTPQTAVPAGAPAWVTARDIDFTIETYGNDYTEPLTREAALEIFLTGMRLIRAIKEAA